MANLEFRDVFEMMDSYMTPEQIAKSDELFEKEILAIKLSQLRKSKNVPQSKMKTFSQTAVSKLEKRKDIKLFTLVNYIKDLGMNIQITASDSENSYTLLNTAKSN